MTALDRIAAALDMHGMCIGCVSVVHPADGLPDGIRSVVLLSPDEPAFWPHLTAQPEYLDGAPDPVDRWSTRVIGGIADELGLPAFFPFGGAPYRPFLAWAERSGRCWPSPVGLLVHDRAGLFISFRGALGLTEIITPGTDPSPCDSCEFQPCRSACPAAALTPAGYDVPGCHAWLDTAAGAICLTGGCQVRRACPVGAHRRLPDQSAHHMKAFHR